jgi:acyl carrier protein
MNNKILNEIESILELPVDSLTGEENLDSLGWDSMAVVMFIAIADDKFNATISPERISRAQSVRDIVELIAKASPNDA